MKPPEAETSTPKKIAGAIHQRAVGGAVRNVETSRDVVRHRIEHLRETPCIGCDVLRVGTCCHLAHHSGAGREVALRIGFDHDAGKLHTWHKGRRLLFLVHASHLQTVREIQPRRRNLHEQLVRPWHGARPGFHRQRLRPGVGVTHKCAHREFQCVADC